MDLIQKYNIPAPRYTSYPTVPFWNNKPGWEAALAQSSTEPLSLYIHLPFCERLCTYCSCNKYITVNHDHEAPYIDAVLKEWALYLQRFPTRPQLQELHLGGGTPTFFSPQNLRYLLETILQSCDVLPGAAFAFEGHPNNTTYEHLQTLYELGFRRVSLGIQDFDLAVQTIINRIQPYENVEQVVREARELGYTSINFDLIYGLPLQTPQSIKATIEKVMRLYPDRISFYSYAHVPWVKGNGQRLFTERDLPKPAVKRGLYELGCAMMKEHYYEEIGMDHFALPDDELYLAQQNGTLHRNFMGYTIHRTSRLLGLGMSAISDHGAAYTQNEKSLTGYQQALEEGRLPVMRAHVQSREDLYLGRHIRELMCNFETACTPSPAVIKHLQEPLRDGLVVVQPGRVAVTEKGKPYIRNICMAFDAYLWENSPNTQVFSGAI
ncbi:oxygen-independent coproporphyrinogen III oxidase [Chitinophaga alhagiae]|uniref:Coproporphyrinogen-III oxidase n=1 Tax=Chitinophaga alhagiae TaxID=2203219 RepID=A0ABM6W996_9BACT|nr:oxygen-independent coproporphyrinogen III oxidase [Chitinophaga alhagiae]AWO00557.1 oxygen-independent coproporphyrinogen III oxidase [Chitinophaga alhagiae]